MRLDKGSSNVLRMRSGTIRVAKTLPLTSIVEEAGVNQGRETPIVCPPFFTKIVQGVVPAKMPSTLTVALPGTEETATYCPRL